MFDAIKRFFVKEETTAITDDCSEDVVRNEPTDTTFYYLNLYLARLNRNYNYMLMEELKSGTIVTQLEDASYEEVKDYCRMVWLPSHPARFIFHAT